MVSKCALIKKQADKKVNLFFLFQLVLQKVSSDVCPDGQVMLRVSLTVMFLLCKSDVMCSTHAPSRRTSLGKAEHHADRHITFHAVEHIVRRVSLRTLGVRGDSVAVFAGSAGYGNCVEKNISVGFTKGK